MNWTAWSIVTSLIKLCIRDTYQRLELTFYFNLNECTAEIRQLLLLNLNKYLKCGGLTINTCNLLTQLKWMAWWRNQSNNEYKISVANILHPNKCSLQKNKYTSFQYKHVHQTIHFRRMKSWGTQKRDC